MKITDTPIGDITPYDRNPRINDNSVPAVAESIREFGFRQPIVVDENMVVIAGHTRLKAARHLGLEKVPVHVASGLSSEQIAAYRLADNRSGQNAQWDDELLSLEMGDLIDAGFDLSLTAFEPGEIEVLTGEANTTGFPELPTGDREKFQQMAFVLHDDQASIVKAAIKKATELSTVNPQINTNKNGNALALICAAYVAQ